MTRIYQLDQVNGGETPDSIDSTYLTVLEDASGLDTNRLSLCQLVNYLFNLAATDETNPFNSFNNQISIGDGSIANENNAVAIGSATASGNYSIGIGDVTSSGYGSVCAGYSSSDSGDVSSLIG